MQTFTRLNGDQLTLRFQPEGTLSTAYLTIPAGSYDVASHLPGLSESNCVQYLSVFGFAPGESAADAPHCSEFVVSSVVESDHGMVALLSALDTRYEPCPRIVAVGEVVDDYVVNSTHRNVAS